MCRFLCEHMFSLLNTTRTDEIAGSNGNYRLNVVGKYRTALWSACPVPHCRPTGHVRGSSCPTSLAALRTIRTFFNAKFTCKCADKQFEAGRVDLAPPSSQGSSPFSLFSALQGCLKASRGRSGRHGPLSVIRSEEGTKGELAKAS